MPGPEESISLFRRPWAESLIRFFMLPSTLLHPSRIRAMLSDNSLSMYEAMAPDERTLRNLHRHWSKELSTRLGFAPLKHVSNPINDPVLALALLPDSALRQAQLQAGAVLAGPAIRHCITRDPQNALRATLGDDLYRFALERAAQLHPGLKESLATPDDQVAQICERWGAAVMARAMRQAGAGVRERALLRLPEQAVTDGEANPINTLSGPQSLALILKLLQSTQSEWLSSFPAAA